MAFYVQYTGDGTISGTILTDGAAPQPPDHISQLTFDEWQQTSGKHVNLSTLELEDSIQ